MENWLYLKPNLFDQPLKEGNTELAVQEHAATAAFICSKVEVAFHDSYCYSIKQHCRDTR